MSGAETGVIIEKPEFDAGERIEDAKALENAKPESTINHASPDDFGPEFEKRLIRKVSFLMKSLAQCA